MKPIDKDELFEHLSGFLKNRGVEIKSGAAAKGIQTGCSVLAEAINLSQAGIELARTGVEKKLDQMRQAIHESTAPKPKTADVKGPAVKATGSKRRSKPKKAGPKSAKRRR
jgi:hypothetical protein